MWPRMAQKTPLLISTVRETHRRWGRRQERGPRSEGLETGGPAKGTALPSPEFWGGTEAPGGRLGAQLQAWVGAGCRELDPSQHKEKTAFISTPPDPLGFTSPSLPSSSPSAGRGTAGGGLEWGGPPKRFSSQPSGSGRYWLGLRSLGPLP